MRVKGAPSPSIYPNETADKRSEMYQLWRVVSMKLLKSGHFVPFLVRNEDLETDLVGECERCEGLVAIDVQDGKAYGSILRSSCGEPYTEPERRDNEDYEV